LTGAGQICEPGADYQNTEIKAGINAMMGFLKRTPTKGDDIVPSICLHKSTASVNNLKKIP
jgi:hypothetical protein